jgi:UDP-sugar transporter A1/2/3
MELSNRNTRSQSDDRQLEEGFQDDTDEHEQLLEDVSLSIPSQDTKKANSAVSRTALFVLILLAVQNCSKNLLMRYVMKDSPAFLTSAAVLGSECIKLACSVCYILLIEKKSLASIFYYLKEDRRNTLLLAVPASAYNFQMSMEYVALANLNAAMFSVLVQSKLLFTATFAAVFLRKRLKYIQVISLVLLTAGVMLCNLSKMLNSSDSVLFDAKTLRGITATLSIAVSSGFASVYTEKVIKGQGAKRTVSDKDFGLAYTQVQLALMSILAIGVYALFSDFKVIVQYGLFHNFTPSAFLSVANSALGGLIVASVLKYADSVLKGYATAISVIFTGVLSMLLFGTQLNTIYFMGIINVVTAVLLYNGQDLDRYVC